MKKKLILVVEDEEVILRPIIHYFEVEREDRDIGFYKCELHICDSSVKALKFYKNNYYDLIILDLRLREGDGIDVLENVREDDKATPILVISGHAGKEDLQEIGKHPNTYLFQKGLPIKKGGLSMFEQFVKCLREGEENFEKTHRDFYIPPVLTTFILKNGKNKIFRNIFSNTNKKKIFEYYRDPQKGFGGKGIIKFLDQFGKSMSEKINVVASELLEPHDQVDFKEIIDRLSGVYSLKNLEQFLKREPNYREHFVHQFQNFLLGCIIYNKFKSGIDPCIRQIFEISSGKKITNDSVLTTLFEISWYLTALFHDYGYPVQYYAKVLSRYFKENFCYRFAPILMNTEDLILHEGLEHYFNSIADDFWYDKDGKKAQERKEEFRTLLVHHFKIRNHAIHSAIALRKLVRYHEYGEKFSKLFASVYSAIAMHDWGLWAHAKAVEDFMSRNKSTFKRGVDFQYKLDFFADLKRNPLLHILIIVDAMQCWGRSVGDKHFYSTNRLELVDIREEDSEDFLTFELNVREALKRNTSKGAFCDYCKTFKTLSVILGTNGLPIKIILNKGLNADNSIIFKLFEKEKIKDCKNTEGCPLKMVRT